MMKDLRSRDPQHLTVWQAWQYLVDKSRMTKAVRRLREEALKAWECHTADPIIMAISPSTLKEFRAQARKAGLLASTIRLYEQQVVKIVRAFRTLELPRRGDVTTEDGQLTIREAFAKHYLPASPGMARRTIQKRKHDFNWWERFTSNPAVSRIGTEVFDEVRKKGLEAGLSPVTIESLVSDALTVLRHLHHTKILPSLPWAGRRLKRRPRLKPTPSIDDLAKVYALADRVTWPVYVRRLICPHGRFTRAERIEHAATWWRGLLAACYFTGLRRGDLLSLRWDEVQDGWIRRTMGKTGFVVEIPIHPILQRHLDALPTKDRPHVLGYGGSFKQIRREMHSLSAAAGVRSLNIQSCRRLAAQSWERARAGCGGLLIGHQYRGSGADRYYLDPAQALVEAIPNLAVPLGMGPQPSRPAPSVNALDVLRGLGRDELIKLLGELLAGKVPV
jgi:integrase